LEKNLEVEEVVKAESSKKSETKTGRTKKIPEKNRLKK